MCGIHLRTISIIKSVKNNYPIQHDDVNDCLLVHPSFYLLINHKLFYIYFSFYILLLMYFNEPNYAMTLVFYHNGFRT